VWFALSSQKLNIKIFGVLILCYLLTRKHDTAPLQLSFCELTLPYRYVSVTFFRHPYRDGGSIAWHLFVIVFFTSCYPSELLGRVVMMQSKWACVVCLSVSRPWCTCPTGPTTLCSRLCSTRCSGSSGWCWTLPTGARSILPPRAWSSGPVTPDTAAVSSPNSDINSLYII